MPLHPCATLQRLRDHAVATAHSMVATACDAPQRLRDDTLSQLGACCPNVVLVGRPGDGKSSLVRAPAHRPIVTVTCGTRSDSALARRAPRAGAISSLSARSVIIGQHRAPCADRARRCLARPATNAAWSRVRARRQCTAGEGRRGFRVMVLIADGRSRCGMTGFITPVAAPHFHGHHTIRLPNNTGGNAAYAVQHVATQAAVQHVATQAAGGRPRSSMAATPYQLARRTHAKCPPG